MYQTEVAATEIIRKNRELYDETFSAVWQYAVYGALHGGWEFINLGGRRMLDEIARRTSLGPRGVVLELCSGQGAACRYLAEFYGCSVTGVEINSMQTARARALLQKSAPRVAERVRLVEGDVMQWRDPGSYDVVFSLDSMMLIPRLKSVFENAFDSLRERGMMAFATIVAGERADDRIRSFVWKNDGMINLLSHDEYEGLLLDAGFEQVESKDFTELSTCASETMRDALEELINEGVDAVDIAEYVEGLEVNDIYLSGFRSGKLGYNLFTGRRP